MASNKVALITGAGSGVGRAVAIKFLKEGYKVGLMGRRADALNETIALAGSGEAIALPADVTDPVQVNAAFDALVAKFGRIDVVFNNAGIGAPPVQWDELPVEQWKAVVDTNLSGVFYCMQAAFRVMKRQNPRGGRIINNGSVSSYTPRPFSAAYTATKHAVLGLTKTGALDGREHDIAVGQIDIGNALTDMARRMTTGVLQANGTTAIEAVMDVEHVANAVAHMASLPLEANVLTMNVMATKMPFVGRG
ncbi:MAG: SDR family NAD(P)-dependent oxidoreductase [Beijerinckiaceae bacterium]|nr:SDR family NAD(P)-dependent oxidoreductase [Beijerinckiaceae bacterium]MCZ8299557.1 SDR family NAD(P)-dependent oxidoreductase [Beijerinckiaceae bacterium]